MTSRKLDTSALTNLFLAQYESNAAAAESIVQKELMHSNQLYYSQTFANEVLNAHVSYLEHKLHCLQREYLTKILEKQKFSDEQKKRILQFQDFISQKIQYDYIMAVRTKNELKERVQELTPKQ